MRTLWFKCRYPIKFINQISIYIERLVLFPGDTLCCLFPFQALLRPIKNSLRAYLFILNDLSREDKYFPFLDKYLLFINKYLSIFAF